MRRALTDCMPVSGDENNRATTIVINVWIYGANGTDRRRTQKDLSSVGRDQVDQHG